MGGLGPPMQVLEVFFSTLKPSAHLRKHCGPINTRLTMHLPLRVPTQPRSVIRVASERKEYVDGEPFVFDDSFEHEVWNEGSETRVILIVIVKHPDLKT